MSHSTVLVIGEDIEKLLAPFDENLEVEPYKDYVAPMPDGWQTTVAHAAAFTSLLDAGVERKDAWKQVWGERNDDPHIPIERSVAKEDGVNPFDNVGVAAHLNAKWAEDAYRVDEQGLYQWSTHNPKSRFDWYSVGGRWAGSLILKPGVEPLPDARGTTGLFSDGTEYTNDAAVDRARWADIDWERMGHIRVAKRRATYAEALADDNDEMREFRWGVKPGETEEDYIRRDFQFFTFAILTPDEEWHERGHMGWWGVVSDEKDTWPEEWRRIVDKHCEDDTIVTVVDVHV